MRVCVCACTRVHTLFGRVAGCRDDLSFRKRMTPAHRAAAPSRPAQQVSLLSVMKWVSREAEREGAQPLRITKTQLYDWASYLTHLSQFP